MENTYQKIEIKVGNESYYRIPIKTQLIMVNDDLSEIVAKFTNDVLEDGDIIFISEKVAAISQGRAYHEDDVKPRKLASFLCKYVSKSPHGKGLGTPQMMEMAIREAGSLRILFAAGVSVITKIFGRSGDFYRVAGDRVRAIDGPPSTTIPPFDEYIVLGPINTDELSKKVKSKLNKNAEVIIVDVNDVGQNILGMSAPLDTEFLEKVLKDNPLGQDDRGTPVGIIRKA